MIELLTPRWYPLRPHPMQLAYWNSPHRFNVVPAGRRSGKTENAKRKLVYRALIGSNHAVPRYFAAAPTRDQCKRIYWDDLKAFAPRRFVSKISDSELMIKFVHGPEIWLVGLDRPQRIEGQPWDGGVIDEIANVHHSAWPAHIRPAMSDRMGWCDFIGCPEGRNHFYELFNKARAEMQAHGSESEWGAFTWKSEDIVAKSEIEAARRDLDPLTYEQEYCASFVSFEGRAYYSFDPDVHCAPLRYDPTAPLILAFDFNVSPGVCAIMQEQELPCGGYGTGVIDEVWVPNNSNTQIVCQRVIQKYDGHKGQFVLYGDATGGARGTAKVAGSDWDLVKEEFRQRWSLSRITFKVDSRNPAERKRINAMNSRLKSGDGTIRMMVDPIRAPHVVKDLEGVALVKNGAGEIDKNYDAALTHISDAVGYYIAKEFPVVRREFREGIRTGT